MDTKKNMKMKATKKTSSVYMIIIIIVKRIEIDGLEVIMVEWFLVELLYFI